MKTEYAVDSRGEIFHLPDKGNNRDVGEVASNEQRIERLNAFISQFFGETDKKVSPMIMGSAIERVVFFTKTQLSSSSQDVRLANELAHHPEIEGERREYLQSIYSDDNDVSSWYYLGVGSIEFERNVYDGEYIDARYLSPIPYTLFMKLLDKEFADCQLLSIGLELTSPQALSEMAFERTTSFDVEIVEALEQYKKDHGYDLKDKDSNKANNCIAAITEYKDNVYPVYQLVKNCIRKTFKDAYNIRYKGNCITAQLDEYQSIELYVVSNDPVVIIIGGNMIYGIDSFWTALTSPELFDETKWFTEKVKPLIN